MPRIRRSRCSAVAAEQYHATAGVGDLPEDVLSQIFALVGVEHAAAHSILARVAPLVSSLEVCTTPAMLLLGRNYLGLGLAGFLRLAQPAMLRTLRLKLQPGSRPDHWPCEAAAAGEGQEELASEEASKALAVALTRFPLLRALDLRLAPLPVEPPGALARLAQLQQLEQLSLSGLAAVPPAVLAAVCQLSRLRCLRLEGPLPPGPAVLQQLTGLAALQQLCLVDCSQEQGLGAAGCAAVVMPSPAAFAALRAYRLECLSSARGDERRGFLLAGTEHLLCSYDSRPLADLGPRGGLYSRLYNIHGSSGNAGMACADGNSSIYGSPSSSRLSASGADAPATSTSGRSSAAGGSLLLCPPDDEFEAHLPALLAAALPGASPPLADLGLFSWALSADQLAGAGALLAHLRRLWLCDCASAEGAGLDDALGVLLRQTPRLEELRLECMDCGVPPCVREAHLRRLFLTDCQLNELPEGPYLAGLEELGLTYNCFTEIPPALAAATRLTCLRLEENPGLHLAMQGARVLGRLQRLHRLYCGSQPLPLEPGVRVYLSQALPGLRLRLDGTPAEDDGGSGSDDDEGDNSATTDGSSGPGGGDDDDSASPDGTSQDRGTSGWDAVADWAA